MEQHQAHLVSVILPSLNEEAAIRTCLEKIYETFEVMGVNGEIIVSDNSNDQTPIIAEAMGARVVTPDQMGYGYAYQCAIDRSSGEFIVMGDADGSYDFRCLPHLLKPLFEDKTDFVIGNRFMGEILDGAMPWLHRYVGNPLLTTGIRILFGVKVSDAQCGFRAIRKRDIDSLGLTSVGMEYATEMVIRSTLMRLRILEVPIVYHPRMGKSKLRSFSDGLRILRLMLECFIMRFLR